MTRVYMIRHGKPASTWGDQGADPDPGLDAQGAEQARGAADALLALPEGERPTRVFTSPLNRCRGTAKPFAEALGVEPVVLPAVAEIPTPAALTSEQRGPWLRRAFGQNFAEVEGDIDYEGWRDAVAAAVTGAVADGAPAAIFTHFVAINAALAVATGEDKVLSFRPDHASITCFEVTEGKLSLVELGRAAETGVL